METILRLYDNKALAAKQREKIREVAQRYSPENLSLLYAEFFARLAAGRHPSKVFRALRPEREIPAASMRALAEAHPWPACRPTDAFVGQEQGWLGGGTEILLARALSPATRLVVELGAWLGLSTRFLAEHAPQATVVSIDHWRGSPEHQKDPRYGTLLPQLYETFLARCWPYRERVIPLRLGTLEGLQTVADHGLLPDLIYIDAEHSFEAVSSELTLGRQLFPGATLVGDDYDWPGVRQAVDAFALRQGMFVDRVGARGWRLLENWQAGEAGQPPASRSQAVVLVPYLGHIEWECEQALQRLEKEGVRVVRSGGNAAIDAARNELLSDALHDGAQAMLFIDADIGFDPNDALRLLARPEPVVCGIYAKKMTRALASHFFPGVSEVLFGPEATGVYPVQFAATGFLRLRASVLRRMIEELKLPLCNTQWGRGFWPFFQPMIIPQEAGKWHYLGEDWSFSYRLGQIGVTPVADTSFRLWHWGRYGFSWEDAGSDFQRFRSYNYRMG